LIHLYRISKGPNVGNILDSIEAFEAFSRDQIPGRYHVDEVSSDPFRSGHTSRRWGVVNASPDGTVTLDRDPWPNF
jgi:hypothetical protein